jgi:hypothetical protein
MVGAKGKITGLESEPKVIKVHVFRPWNFEKIKRARKILPVFQNRN